MRCSPELRKHKPSSPLGAGGKGFDGALTAAANSSGITVTEKSALTLVAAFACQNVLATDLSFLPVCLFRERKSGGRDEVKDHSTYPLLKYSPDGETTPMRARTSWYGHLYGWGNGYKEIVRDGSGDPVSFHSLEPSTTEPKRRKRDQRLYYSIDNGRDTLLPENVLHIAGLGYDGLVGYSPVRMARQAIGMGLAAETFGAALFGNGSNARGVLEVPDTLTDESFARLRDSFERVHQGPANAHRVAILEQGAKWTQTSINPEDAQFLLTRAFQVIEICRLYQVPPHKVMDFSQAHMNNVEATNLDYTITTILPWCVATEQEYNLKLLTRAERNKGYSFEHGLTALLRGDLKAQGEWYQKLRDLGVYTPNRIAQAINENPIGPEGDLHLVPANMITLAKARDYTPGKQKKSDANP